MSQLSTQARITPEYKYEDIGFNFRMTNLNAAVGLAQLERLDEMLVAKRAIAERYDVAISEHSDIMPMPHCVWAESSKWLYAVLCSSKNGAKSLVSHLKASGIESNIFWLSLSDQVPYEKCLSRLTGVSKDLSNRVVILPCSSALSTEDQMRVILSLGEWKGPKLIT
jgi:dTDP-4-amino-4,6-dideoxygalactose transaminase